MNKTELELGIQGFWGSDEIYFNPLYPSLSYTMGVEFFLENAGNGAYWMLDIIGTEVHPLQSKEGFISIFLDVANQCAKLYATDGNDLVLWERNIDYTDCPEGVWKFFLVNNVLLLPGEY